MGFVIARRAVLERCEGNSHSLSMDLYDQWVYMQKTTQWRYTPPTHVVAALRLRHRRSTWRKAGVPARCARYAAQLPHAARRHGRSSDCAASCRPDIQAPIIVTFHAPR